jgi:hypothetical protein
MPTGTGADTLQNIPAQPYVMDPGQFFALTEKNVLTARIQQVGSGGFAPAQLLQSGVLSKVVLVFEGTLTVATAAVTTGDEWPHKLLSGLRLSANGQNDLFNVDGCDLAVLRFVRYPAFDDRVDVFPGTVGGGNSVAVGTYPLYLTFEVPVSMDDTTLVGALYAQSSSSNFQVSINQAAMAELFSANPGNATITGAWSIQETIFEIPYDSEGRLVVPDLSRLHQVTALNTTIAAGGEQRIPLIRGAGQLHRLFLEARGSATNRLSAMPNAAASKLIEALRLEYGGNKRPFDFNPAATLLSRNNEHYGAPAPYDRMVLDLLRENPARDAIILQGVTELAVVPTIGSGVTVAGGRVRVLQETLF